MIKKPELISDLVVDSNSVMDGSGMFVVVNDPAPTKAPIISATDFPRQETLKTDLASAPAST